MACIFRVFFKLHFSSFLLPLPVLLCDLHVWHSLDAGRAVVSNPLSNPKRSGAVLGEGRGWLVRRCTVLPGVILTVPEKVPKTGEQTSHPANPWVR